MLLAWTLGSYRLIPLAVLYSVSLIWTKNSIPVSMLRHAFCQTLTMRTLLLSNMSFAFLSCSWSWDFVTVIRNELTHTFPIAFPQVSPSGEVRGIRQMETKWRACYLLTHRCVCFQGPSGTSGLFLTHYIQDDSSFSAVHSNHHFIVKEDLHRPL